MPTGWHVPTDENWTELVNFLGGDQIARVPLKQSGISYWCSPNEGGNLDSLLILMDRGLQHLVSLTQ